eukprot:g282.t1
MNETKAVGNTSHYSGRDNPVSPRNRRQQRQNDRSRGKGNKDDCWSAARRKRSGIDVKMFEFMSTTKDLSLVTTEGDTHLFEEGSYADACYLMLAGNAHLTQGLNEYHQPNVLFRLGPGALVGEKAIIASSSSVFSGGRRNFETGVFATETSLWLKMPRRLYKEALRRRQRRLLHRDIAFLRSTGLFPDDATDDELIVLLPLFRIHYVYRDDPLYGKGDYTNNIIHFVAEGKVDLVLVSPEAASRLALGLGGMGAGRSGGSDNSVLLNKASVEKVAPTVEELHAITVSRAKREAKSNQSDDPLQEEEETLSPIRKYGALKALPMVSLGPGQYTGDIEACSVTKDENDKVVPRKAIATAIVRSFKARIFSFCMNSEISFEKLEVKERKVAADKRADELIVQRAKSHLSGMIRTIKKNVEMRENNWK